MTTGKQKVVFLAVGFLLLSFTTCSIQMAAMVEGPDRSNAVQVPLLLLVLAIPGAAFALRRSRSRVLVSLVVAQIGAYGLYETGMSIETNIRIDLLLVYPAILVSGWFAFRAASDEFDDQDHPVQSPEAVPADRTKCDACGEVFPSHLYLQAGGARGFICRQCAEKP